MIIIKWIISIVVVFLIGSYQWGVYETEAQWTDKDPTWIILKNIGLFIFKTIVALLIVLGTGEISNEDLQHYEPKY